MVRHVFMAAFKTDATKDQIQKAFDDLKAVKEKIPNVIDVAVGYVVGDKGKLVMTVDFESRADFEAYANHPYHADYLTRASEEYFDPYRFHVVQFEF